jgi:quinol monooxygenase YgiN
MFLAGCNSSHNSGSAAALAPVAPFDAMVIRHTVTDYSKWKPAFDADASFREAAGVHSICVARGMEDANDIEVPTFIDDVQKAKAFGAAPRLKDVMEKGGVTSAPDIKFIHVLRFTDAGKCNYAEMTVQVKDFDAWLKVFDAEGAATRKKDGLTDIALGRGIDDPNLVYLVFKINSVAEANAAMANPARQKLMEESGVEGKPAMYFGSDQ